MSDTPISDSTPHNVAELGMLCRKFERELDAANDHIKRLQEAGDAMERLLPDGSICDKVANLWRTSKEAKP
jgi:hypothetical protein